MQEPSSSISSFKRFLSGVLLPLLTVVAAAGILFSFLFEKKIILKSQVAGAYKINRVLTQTRPGEIPIFGSSRAEYGFIPDSLGKDFFNYGMAGTKTDVLLFFLKQECSKQKIQPRIIINFDLDGLDYKIGDIAAYIPNADKPGIRQLLGKEYRAYFSIPFIKYFGRYETYFRLLMTERIELTKVVNKGGSFDKNILPPDQFATLVDQRRKTRLSFYNDPMLQQELLGILAAHPERKFVFVVSPYHESWFEGFTNLEQAKAFLDTLSAYSNVRIFDFSRFPLQDSMFLNTTHINYRGAMLFSRALRDSLKAAGLR